MASLQSMMKGRVSLGAGRQAGEEREGCAVDLELFDVFKAWLQRCSALGVFVPG